MDTHDDDVWTLVSETQKAREALEVKGVFLDSNAATHLVLALEALIKLQGYDEAVRLNEVFSTATSAH